MVIRNADGKVLKPEQLFSEEKRLELNTFFGNNKRGNLADVSGTFEMGENDQDGDPSGFTMAQEGGRGGGMLAPGGRSAIGGPSGSLIGPRGVGGIGDPSYLLWSKDCSPAYRRTSDQSLS